MEHHGRRSVIFALLLLLTVLLGVVGFMLLEGFTFTEAMYMTVITMGTVGFREVHPLGETKYLIPFLMMKDIEFRLTISFAELSGSCRIGF